MDTSIKMMPFNKNSQKNEVMGYSEVNLIILQNFLKNRGNCVYLLTAYE